MPMRRNAGLGMARVLELVDEIAWAHKPDAVGAAGHIDVYPNSRNVIPGKCVFTVDLRSPDLTTIEEMVTQMKAGARKICDEMGLGVEFEAAWSESLDWSPEVFANRMRALAAHRPLEAK